MELFVQSVKVACGPLWDLVGCDVPEVRQTSM
jgi:hypothetical protein